MRSLPCLALLALLPLACTGEAVTEPADPAATPDATPDTQKTLVITTAEIHDAICGHVLEDVGHCGNYIKIDGEYVVLDHPSLGKMDYCSAGDKGARVEVTGEMKDGKFVASSYRRVE